MSRTAKGTLIALIILWLSGWRAGQGDWFVAFLELILFFFIMHLVKISKE